MLKEDVQLAVRQQIKYPHRHELDLFEHKVKGILYKLKTYTKIQYPDQNNHQTEVKLTQLKKDQYQVEVKQTHSQAHFVFQKGITTYTPYTTPQGIWELAVEVDELDVTFDESLIIHIEYSLLMEEELLAEYQFDLEMMRI